MRIIFLVIAAALFHQSLIAQKATNPIIFADVPDISIVHVGDSYYMSSTTMHMSPGVPIMKSKDLVNWHLVSYAYDTLADMDELNLENGKSTYGRGSWASSIRYHNGTYYVSTFAQTTGRTHVYTTKNIEKGLWKAISFRPAYHDHSLFFDDDGRVYMIYGVGRLKLIELNADVSGVKPGTTEQVIIEHANLPSGGGPGLAGEGSQLFKYNGKYYLFNITWPRGGMRTVVIHRADKITGPYEGKLGLQDLGVAQGGMIDGPDGNWYAYLFRDFGSVGRIPYLVPIKWVDGWPVIGVNGKVPETLDLPANKKLIPGIVNSDDFTRKKDEAPLPLVWQWNHNPDNKLWSLTQRPGFLRLTTGRVDTSILLAKNMLTQRTIGPVCEGSTFLDLSHMKEGDFAGLCLLQKNYGLVGVRLNSGDKSIVMINAGTGTPQEVQTIPLNQNKVFFKAECDFTNKKDTADFFYSLDGKSWKSIGTPLKMSYTLPHFMGYRFGLFNYATQNTGGYVDFDYFHISDVISSSSAKTQTADEIINRYIQFTGGVENWKSVKTITTTGTYNYGGIAFPFVSWSKAPNLYLYVVTFNGRSFSQAYNGELGWRIDGFKNEKTKTILKDKQATAMANEADVELESPFINYLQKGNSVELQGTDSVTGRPCFKIRLIAKGDTAVYSFAKDDYSLLKKQAVSKNSEMPNALLDIFYSDYQSTGNIKLPHKISCTERGQKILIITVDSLKLNEPVADSIFQP